MSSNEQHKNYPYTHIMISIKSNFSKNLEEFKIFFSGRTTKKVVEIRTLEGSKVKVY